VAGRKPAPGLADELRWIKFAWADLAAGPAEKALGKNMAQVAGSCLGKVFYEVKFAPGCQRFFAGNPVDGADRSTGAAFGAFIFFHRTSIYARAGIP